MYKNYIIYLWCGSGYLLSGPFGAFATCEEQAIEIVTKELIELGLTELYFTAEQYDRLCKDFQYDPGEHFGDDMEGFLYVDGTMEGAKFPVYLRTENMRIEVAA